MDKPIGGKQKIKSGNTDKKRSSNKLSYKLKMELDALPKKIEVLEKKIAELEQQTQHDDFYSRPYEEQQPLLDELNIKHKDLDTAIRRWDELENMQKELQGN